MSVQAIVWLLEDCPDLPKHLVGTMVGLANHADQNGRGAYPSQELLAWYARKDERSIRRDLEQAEELDLIRRGDQRMVLHLPADKRPVVYDLAMERKRDPRPDAKTAGRPKKATAKDQASTPAEAPENRGDAHVRPDADVQIGGTWASNPGDVDVRRTALDPSLEPNTPLTDLVTDAAGARVAEAAEGGKFSPEDKAKLTAAVDAAVEARKTRTGWARPAVVEAVSAALDAGHPLDLVVATLGQLAADLGGTDYPTRLAPFLAIKTRKAAPLAASAPAEPYRHKPAAPCVKGCDCWKHQAEPGQHPGISEDAAAVIAEARAKLRPGKPLWRRPGSGATAPRTNASTTASDDVEAANAPMSVNA